jgi:DNA-binding response OmpR family regulator
MEEARSLMMRCGPPSVVICEQDLPDGNWHLLFQQTEALSRPPSFIISSRLADEHLWSEVLNLGGFDVLSTPFAAREVFHVVCCASDSWPQQWGIAATRQQVAEAGASKALSAGAGS